MLENSNNSFRHNPIFKIMDQSKSDDTIRIFVFRPYIPIFLRTENISNYDNLLSELSNQCGTEIQSLHHMKGTEVSSSEELKKDKVYIVVEKNNSQLNDPGTDFAQTTSELSSTMDSDTTIHSDSLTRNYHRNHLRKGSKSKSLEGILYIYVHNLYTYKNSLLPYGCTLMYRDLESMDSLLQTLGKSLNTPGSYITNLYDINKNEIKSTRQLKNEHKYIAMPHIISHEGFNFLRNLTPESIKKYKKSSDNFSLTKMRKKSEVFQTLSPSTTSNNNLQKTSPGKSNEVSDTGSKNYLLDNEPLMTDYETVSDSKPSSSKDRDSDNTDKLEKLTSNNDERISIKKSDKEHEHDVISYYTVHCNNNQRHIGVGHICQCINSYNSNGDKVSIFPCNKTKASTEDCRSCTEENGTPEKINDDDLTFSMEEIRPYSTITKIAEVLMNSREVSEQMTLKKTSHHRNLNVLERPHSNRQSYEELSANLLQSLLLELERKKISLEKGTPNEQIVEPMLLTFCELMANIFQTISKSLHGKTNE